MPSFILTATHNIERPQIGLHVDRGQQFTVHINTIGITPINLFNNPRCQAALTQQFQMNGINVPKTDYGIYSRGSWDIKMV